MKRTSHSLIIALVASFLLSCSASRNATLSTIGLVPLADYTITNNAVKDTVYRVVRNDADFDALVRATSANAKRPGFDGQMVVALFTEAPSSLQFVQAGFMGKNVQVYLASCNAAQPCSTGKVFLATIPKVGSAKRIQFFINNETKATVEL
ncbi:MAG TPA: hypothetical protein VMR70_07715 [Flavisolibacter sp.]|nr:hypothetical protein [Flavisolibacter sp.]